MERNIERLEILRERADLYAQMIKDLWNGVPEEDKPLLLFTMETTACAVRKAWPATSAKADILDKIFDSTVVTASVPRKENDR